MLYYGFFFFFLPMCEYAIYLKNSVCMLEIKSKKYTLHLESFSVSGQISMLLHNTSKTKEKSSLNTFDFNFVLKYLPQCKVLTATNQSHLTLALRISHLYSELGFKYNCYGKKQKLLRESEFYVFSCLKSILA